MNESDTFRKLKRIHPEWCYELSLEVDKEKIKIDNVEYAWQASEEAFVKALHNLFWNVEDYFKSYYRNNMPTSFTQARYTELRAIEKELYGQ